MMWSTKRAGVAVAVAAALACGIGVAAYAQTKYPKDTVTLVTHSSPGGGSDVFLREMAPHLSRLMGANFVVENIRGGSGAKAMAALAKAKPDGGMFYATTPTFIYTSLMSKPAATYRDLEPLVNVFYDPEVIYTAADSKFKTLQDVIDQARKGGGKWGAANPASLERQVLERMKALAKVTPAIATFEGGGDLLINVLNHTLDIGVGEVQEIRSQLEGKKVRLLAVVSDQRLTQFPDLKTVKEQGIDLSVRKFRGLAGPKGTPPEVIKAWEAGIQKLLADPAYKKIYTDNNLQAGFIGHAEYVKFIDQFGKETEAFLKQSGVVK